MQPQWEVFIQKGDEIKQHARSAQLILHADVSWKSLSGVFSNAEHITVLQTDTGEHVNSTKAFERTVVKELGKFLPYLRKKGDPRSLGVKKIGVATVY